MFVHLISPPQPKNPVLTPAHIYNLPASLSPYMHNSYSPYSTQESEEEEDVIVRGQGRHKAKDSIEGEAGDEARPPSNHV